jgi:hypothetical protein
MLSVKKLIEGAKSCLPDAIFLMIWHRRKVGRFPNIWNPRTFNERILHRCLYPDPRYRDLADKLKVRDYVARKIGPNHLIPLLAAPDEFTREVFDELPSAFVMKSNHGSGFVKIVKNKSTVSFEELSALAKEWLSTDFYKIARERHYRDIKPRIFFEKLLLGKDDVVPADLKVHVFNRQQDNPTMFITVISDRFGEHPRADTYNANWELQEIWTGHYGRSEKLASRLGELDSLISVARALASEFDYVRVDAYELAGTIYFGELTFTPGAGFFPMKPDSIDYAWGRLINPEPSKPEPSKVYERA